MAAPLTDQFGFEVPRRIAARTAATWPDFPVRSFLAEVGAGFDDLGLTDRARRIAGALGTALPADFPTSAGILEATLGPPRPIDGADGDGGMDAFVDLPLVYWVAEAGLADPERALAFQRELTRRLSAEFSIRAYIEQHPDLTMATLARWATDPDGRVRRLVSEGTRPRLPWASQLTEFRRDPAPVLSLLEALKDDPSDSVRRSVANNLNDISKDHPDIALTTARAWMRDAGPRRRSLVRHALRSLLRDADPAAFTVLGLAGEDRVAVDALTVEPVAPRIGEHADVTWEVASTSTEAVPVMVHLRVHYSRPREPVAKTFLIGEREVPARGRVAMRRRLSLRQMSTRKHHPGRHRVEVLVNGRPLGDAVFEVRAGDG